MKNHNYQTSQVSALQTLKKAKNELFKQALLVQILRWAKIQRFQLGRPAVGHLVLIFPQP
jgi:hypothetical protein